MYKQKIIYIALFIIVLLSVLVYARSFTPYGDIDMMDLLGIYNVTEMTIKDAPTDDDEVPNKAYVDDLVGLMTPPAYDYVLYNYTSNGYDVNEVTYKIGGANGTIVASTVFTYDSPITANILYENMTVGTEVYIAFYEYTENNVPLSKTITIN